MLKLTKTSAILFSMLVVSCFAITAEAKSDRDFRLDNLTALPVHTTVTNLSKIKNSSVINEKTIAPYGALHFYLSMRTNGFKGHTGHLTLNLTNEQDHSTIAQVKITMKKNDLIGDISTRCELEYQSPIYHVIFPPNHDGEYFSGCHIQVVKS